MYVKTALVLIANPLLRKMHEGPFFIWAFAIQHWRMLRLYLHPVVPIYTNIFYATSLSSIQIKEEAWTILSIPPPHFVNDMYRDR
jgi:hypothetical protein